MQRKLCHQGRQGHPKHRREEPDRDIDSTKVEKLVALRFQEFGRSCGVSASASGLLEPWNVMAQGLRIDWCAIIRQKKKESDKTKPDTNSIRDGIEHEPGGGKALINPVDTVLLLLDHQSGLFQVVKDIEVAQLRANTAMLAKLGSLRKLIDRNTNSLRFTRLAGLFQKLGHCGERATNFWVCRCQRAIP